MTKHHNDISIHAAREGGDKPRRHHPRLYGAFQSTPPVKAATEYTFPLGISIHAAREGGDLGNCDCAARHRHFNPRRP